MPNDAAIAVTLGRVAASGTLVPVDVAHGAAGLRHLTVAGAGVNGITQSLTASVTLRSLAAAATGLKQHGDGAATLRALSVAGAGRTGVTQHLGAAVGLGRVSPSANLVNRYLGVAPRVERISGVLRSNGAARFQYTGKANAGVIWEISAGSGNLTPDHPYTDEHGVCLASYEPEGYEGQLTIQVHFA